MASLDQMQLLMEEFGPATEEVAEVQQQGDGAWSIFFDADTEVGLDFVADQEKLVLSIELGAPPEELKASTHEFILIYNFNWTQSGGIKIGLEAPGGSLVMMFELNASSLDLTTLQQYVAGFVEKAQAWRELVATGIQAETSPDSSQIPDELASAIRV